jgi:uncharacterized protein YegJ (DUF2314 family)
MAELMHFQYAVYLLPGHPVQQVDSLRALGDVLKAFPDLTLVDKLPAQPERMFVHAFVQEHVKKEYAPPDLGSLRYHERGLTSDQEHALQQCDRALILSFVHPKKYVWTGLHNSDAIVDELVRRTGGLAWDEETREMYSSEAWHKRRVAAWLRKVPDVPNETVIHAYDDESSMRAVTLGMSKMGLPDIMINFSGWSSESQIGDVINIFSQSLAEGEMMPAKGDFKLDLFALKNSQFRDDQLKSIKGKGIGVGCLSVEPGKWEEGDAKNRLIQLGFDRYPGSDPDARQESMISSFFGAEDSISHIDHSDELLATSTKAKAKLPDQQKAFAAGLEPGEYIEVKAPFRTEDGGNEWMWVEVTKWKGDVIEGVLQNDPEKVRGLRAGQRVKVHQQDVFDYLHHFSDKRTEGNTTGEIIRKMSEQNGGFQDVAAAISVPSCGDE